MSRFNNTNIVCSKQLHKEPIHGEVQRI